MLEIKKLTPDDVKDKSLVYLLVRASHELESGENAYPACMASLFGQRLLGELYNDDGTPKVLPPEVEAAWEKALALTVPGNQPAAERAALLTTMQNDLVALKDYNPKTADPSRLQEMMVFMAALRDGLEGRTRSAVHVAVRDSRAA